MTKRNGPDAPARDAPAQKSKSQGDHGASERFVQALHGEKHTAHYGLLESDLPPAALKVGLALLAHANFKTGRCDPGVERLARETHQCVRNVRRGLRALEKAGIVRTARHGGSALQNAYDINRALLWERGNAWFTRAGFIKTPDKTVRSPRTKLSATPGQNCPPKRRKEKIKRKEEGRSAASASPKRDAASRQGYQRVRNGKDAETLYHPAKPKTPSSASAAREKAQERLDRDLRNELPKSVYPDVVAGLDPSTHQQAIRAEIAKPGKKAGMVIVLEHRAEGVTPP